LEPYQRVLLAKVVQDLRRRRRTSGRGLRPERPPLRLSPWAATELTQMLDLTEQEHYCPEPDEMLDLELIRYSLATAEEAIIERPRTGPASVCREALVDLTSLGAVRKLELKRVRAGQARSLTEEVRQRLVTLAISDCQGLKPKTDLSLNGLTSSPAWPHLTHLSISRCKLTSLPVTMAAHMPKLEVLDVAFNAFTYLPGVAYMANLRRLDAGYNHLTCVPSFHGQAGRSLQALSLANNRLPSLEGIGAASALRVLDVSFNVLIEHVDLGHVCLLSRLVRLETGGNAAARSVSHREDTLAYVHPEVDIGVFSLDGKRLTDSEAFMVGLARVVPARPAHPPRHPRELERSLAAPADDDGAASSSVVSSVAVGGARPKVRTSRRGRRVREAKIHDPEVAQTNEERQAILAKKVFQPESAADEQADHLEAKRKIEALRADYGEHNWLQGQAGDSVQRALGLPEEGRLTSELIAARISEAQAREERLSKYVAEQRPERELEREERAPSVEVLQEDPVQNVEPALPSATASSSALVSEGTADGSNEMQTSFYALYGGREESPEKDEDEGALLVVPVTLDDLEMSLVVVGDFVREKKADSGLIVNQWFLHHLDVCDVLKKEDNHGLVVALEFLDSRSGVRTKRKYAMSAENARKLADLTRPVLEAQRRHALRLGAMQCLRCSAQFTEDSNKSETLLYFLFADPCLIGDQHFCPLCGSAMVIRLEATPVPTATNGAHKEMSSSVSSLNEDSFKQNMKNTSTPHKKNGERDAENEGKKPKSCLFWEVTYWRWEFRMLAYRISSICCRPQIAAALELLPHPKGC